MLTVIFLLIENVIEEIHYRGKTNRMVSFLLVDNNNVVCNPECRWFAGGSKIMIGDP